MQKTSLLADYADLRAQLHYDQEVDRDVLKQRDRRIGLAQSANTDQQSLRNWAAAMRSSESLTAYPGAELHRLVRTAILVLWAFGLIAGALLARTVLDYDGRQPVNLFSVLLILIGLQLVALLLLATLTMFGGRGILHALSVFNPAQWVMKLLRRFPLHSTTSPGLSTIAEMLDGQADPAAKRSGLSLLVYLSQHFSVALNVGIIATLMYLVAISDLAFGWNTTLSVDSDSVLGWFRALSWPWQSVLPAAVPDAALVEQSRFYRLEGQLRGSDWQVDQYGTWWLFILACLLVYGFVPRLIALVAYGLHYDRTLAQSLLNTPGASQVIARMRSPLVSTDAEPGQADQVDMVSRPLPRKRQAGRTLSCTLVCWSGVEPPEVRIPGITITDHQDAGGQRSLEEDRQLATVIAKSKSDGVVIAVKAWEPPTLEINDFISFLRKQMGATPIVLVLLVPIRGQQVSTVQLETWETGLSSLADPALYAEPLS